MSINIKDITAENLIDLGYSHNLWKHDGEYFEECVKKIGEFENNEFKIEITFDFETHTYNYTDLSIASDYDCITTRVFPQTLEELKLLEQLLIPKS